MRYLILLSFIILTACEGYMPLQKEPVLDVETTESFAEIDRSPKKTSLPNNAPVLPFDTFKPKEISRDTFTVTVPSSTELPGVDSAIRAFIQKNSNHPVSQKNNVIEYRATPKQQRVIEGYLSSYITRPEILEWQVEMITTAVLPQPVEKPLIDLVPLGESIKVYKLQQSPNFYQIADSAGRKLIGTSAPQQADFRTVTDYVAALERQNGNVKVQNDVYKTGVSLTIITKEIGPVLPINIKISSDAFIKLNEKTTGSSIKRTPDIKSSSVSLDLNATQTDIIYIIGIPNYPQTALILKPTVKQYRFAETPAKQPVTDLVEKTSLAKTTQKQIFVSPEALTKLQKPGVPNTLGNIDIDSLVTNSPNGKIVFKDKTRVSTKAQNLPPVQQTTLPNLNDIPNGLTNPADIDAYLNAVGNTPSTPIGSALASESIPNINLKNVQPSQVKRMKRIRLSKEALNKIQGEPVVTSSPSTQGNSLKDRIKKIAPQNGIIVVD